MSDWNVAHEALETDKQNEKDLKEAKLKLAVYESLKQARSIKIPSYRSKRGAATAVALLSDVHAGERVRPEDVPGVLNEYDPDICKRRIAQYAQRLVLLLDSYRHLTAVDDLVLAILGDIMTGYLHDDQKESNHLSPLEEILFAEELICGLIEYVLSKGNLKRLVIPCCYGNHGRMTEKIRASTARETSYEWMMYNHIAKRWAGEKRVHFHIAQGMHQYLDVAGFKCRFHHGDGIRYNGGVGGISIPLNKAVAQWNKITNADYDFIGHWHTCKDFGNVVVNGSLIGYNAYALRIKADFEPPRQSLSFIDHKKGKCAHLDIWTDFMPT